MTKVAITAWQNDVALLLGNFYDIWCSTHPSLRIKLIAVFKTCCLLQRLNAVLRYAVFFYFWCFIKPSNLWQFSCWIKIRNQGEILEFMMWVSVKGSLYTSNKPFNADKVAGVWMAHTWQVSLSLFPPFCCFPHPEDFLSFCLQGKQIFASPLLLVCNYWISSIYTWTHTIIRTVSPS